MPREIRINFADLKDGLNQIRDTLKTDNRTMEKLVRKQAEGLEGRAFKNFVGNFMESSNRVSEEK